MSRYQQRRVDELEADIRQSRAHLDDTLHELERRLSPARLRRSVAAHLPSRHGARPGFLAGLGRSIREHPVPVLVTGIGLGWLVASQLRAGSHGRAGADGADSTLPARQEAPQRMVATHLGTQQGRGVHSTHRPDVVGQATHLGTGQGWQGYVYPGA
ncbi:DUF3618 domain-containing protein [Halomonas sp. MCCC 1A17488]|uniref:DUF3618 domain-containing protein n=1 Tax=Billgrantia sulfidoxydans TaxID=2733484 RepID=A0ABX7WB19_9GAMM|nr:MULTISPECIES: DUF3618 domain-containing protein [Halomonas]MCE8017753.1 DUF3618 domain-containing protein [Halomonas sp. MCCC 1A17488]MCG3241086.1 DUF3618 domain-containing protein [Halomonas sp. MCCC 1A17488]QPP48946.1 DUF3618 domain-containing protein [Halomonas sp. SS10-MC5]QTP56263.1 DUF3618 domain-containing protein [Halomonas sulfidoxydans]